jgi:hypothetical protein
MAKSSLVYNTLLFSIVIQIVAGIISAYALTLPLKDEHSVYRELLGLDTVVQFIEASFYAIFIYFFSTIGNMATIRYYDWFITTPIMLFTTIALFRYNSLTCVKRREKFNIIDFAKENKSSVIFILVTNFLMLLSGYLGELKYISVPVATIVGFIFFGLSFYRMYTDYALLDSSNLNYYYLFTGLWALYGVAYLFNDSLKNTAYNILDIFSKNVYGLLLVYVIWMNSKLV